MPQKILSILWRILGNVAVTGVILAILQIGKSPFEKIVVSSLVLIYIMVVSSFTGLSFTLFKKIQQDIERFIVIAKALHLNTEIYEEAHKESKDDFEKGQAAFSINVFFILLNTLIAIWYLLYSFA